MKSVDEKRGLFLVSCDKGGGVFDGHSSFHKAE